ncbi:ABC transporter ATP-binding protein [Streptomyces longwoodensis]|uniref:ATP-binding cassette domain-containing protein n=1 Tax=Streptomyces longwoodensis TaxID=68231 RepID=UPI00386FD8BC
MRLDIEDVTLEVAGTRLVEHIDLTVGSGAFAGLVGPNGSGKSTLLRALYRALRPAGGVVRLDGDDLHAMDARAAARRLAALPQESSAEFDFTAAEVVAMGRLPHRDRTAASDREIVARAMERTGGGRVVAHGPPHDVLRPPLLAEVFGVRAHPVRHPVTGAVQLLFDLLPPLA